MKYLKFSLLPLLFVLILSSVLAYNLISNKFGFQYNPDTQESPGNIINYDNYSLNNASSINENIEIYTGNNGVIIKQVSRYDDEYINNGLRIKITGIGDVNNDPYKPFFITTRFGRFEIKDAIKGYKKTDGVFCNGELVYYSLSGTISSYGDNDGFDGTDGNGDYWGEMSLIQNESYFCPRSKEFKLVFDSAHLGKMEISTGSGVYVYDILNPYNHEVHVNSLNAFDNKKVYISGILKSNYIDRDSIDYNGEVGNSSHQSSLLIYGKGNTPFVYGNIMKNVELLTRGLKAINLDSTDDLYDFDTAEQLLEDLSDSREVFYYNYNGLENSNGASNENNKGMIIRLGDNGTGKIGVNGNKVLIVKGGNLYIDTNIYNEDKNSLLTIVVKRDDNNKENGGNIYIDPDVTNIDAILIADGSLLSFKSDGSNYNIYNSIDNSNILKKQLLIYGAVISKNTIGINQSPYGSDNYIKNGGFSSASNYYNLANLRSFEVELVTGGMGGDCDEENKIRSMGGDKYMFAGRKECYLDDSPESDLKGSDKISPLLIYYNPMIQILNPKILQIK